MNFANHPHPRINTVEGRARRSLIEAGLNKSKKHDAEPGFDSSLDLDSSEVKFGRLLAGSDVKARHRGVQKLKQYIRSRCSMDNENGGMSELDLMKLWKGLWYCLYLADKVPVQDELSKNIAELLFCFEGTKEEDEYAARLYLEITTNAKDDEIDEDHVHGSHCDHEDAASTDESDMIEVDEEMDGEDKENSHIMEAEEEEEEEGEEEEEEEEEDATLVKHCRGAHLASAFCRTFFRTIRKNWGITDYHRIDKFYTLMRYVLHQMYVYMASRSFNLGIVRLFNDALFEEILSMIPNGLRCHIIDISVAELAKAWSTNDNVPGDLKLSGVNVEDIASFLFDIASDEATLAKNRDSMYDLHKEYRRKVKETEEKKAEAKKLREVVSSPKKKEKNKVSLKVENGTMPSSSEREEHTTVSSEATLAENSSLGELHERSDNVEESRSSKKKKKKSKKSKKSCEVSEVKEESAVPESSSTNDSNSDLATGDEDLTYTISLEDQKAFAKANMKKEKKDKKEKKEKKRKSKSMPEKGKEDEEKRVKFRKMNQSKTYKASMRGLRTAEIELSRTPEKSILVRKATPGMSTSASKSKKKRKKDL
eukprot:CAMPEP_0116040818 /NCGR_PEP_ID=MMETSP0321-20121206/24618_1 /TAXON_ID=163516 /ORGANISM="Leptocylindrus danicus var. danicus, Strain B650" /LENGTH=593 /DNA_ID=CAMNT_0003520771 /DNA_START=113 /DNA_END=1895 /DNA_ORIENTATION=+